MALNENSGNKDIPAILGEHTANGFGVFGKSDLGAGVGVHGENGGGNIGPDRGVGVWGESQIGFGVFGSSDSHRGVRGVSKVSVGVNGINEAPPKFFQPDRGCGVHGESINGFGVCGVSENHEGVRGTSRSGTGVFGSSEQGEGLHAETKSNTLAAIAAFVRNPNAIGAALHAETEGRGAGLFARSQQGEGVHAETNANDLAAIAAVVRNPIATGAALFAANEGRGVGVLARGGGGRPAGLFEGDVEVTGTVKTTDVRITAADCAEDFQVCETGAEPGTVMVINDDGMLHPSKCAYDTRVAGVISGAGEFRPGIVLDSQSDRAYCRRPVALVGKVFCKVDATYTPIRIGDMLTTSPTPGYAMAVRESIKAFGAVIGKALQPLNEGRGLIPILVALQ